MTDNENKQRRIDDRLPDAKIDWNEPGAPAVQAAEVNGFAQRENKAKLEELLNLLMQVSGYELPSGAGRKLDEADAICRELVEGDNPAPSQAAAEARNQALEEAILACEEVEEECQSENFGKYPELQMPAEDGARRCVARLCALKGAEAPATAGQSDIERDAARYRWLRDGRNVAAVSLVDMHGLDALDTAIDAATSAEQSAQREKGGDGE